MPKLITLPQIKEYLKLTTSAIDNQIELLANSAEDWIAGQCGTAFQTQQITEIHNGYGDSIRPLRQPILGIDSIIDLYGAYDAPTSQFALRGGPNIKRLYFCPYGPIPQHIPQGLARWEITYRFGYNNGDPADAKPEGSMAAPDGLITPLLMLIRRHYESRGNQIVYTQGTSVNWGTLAGGDILDLLAPFDLKPAF